MEAMCFGIDDYVDKFKHTLKHLAIEWYYGLDMDQFGGNWHEFTRYFSRYFSTQGSKTYMKGGEHSPLKQIWMI